MLCILCVSQSDHVIPIFEEEGSALHISEIIIKHFWLQPNVDDSDTSVICISCWTALDSFHKFYLQVEEAHEKLLKAKAIVDSDDLKLESETGQQHNSVFEVEPELLNADIKLEVQEDLDVILPPDIDKESTFDPVQNDSTDCKKSIDSKTPASQNSTRTTRSRTSTEKSYNDYSTDNDDKDSDDNRRPSSSIDWQEQNSDDDDDDDDSDYEDGTSKAKAKTKSQPEQSSIGGKKRGRPRKGDSSSHKRKRNSESQSTKMERVREYDEIIAKNVKLSCTKCSIEITNFATLKRHYRSVHNECGYATCCSKKFLKRGMLVDHIYTHLNPEYFKCEKCGKVLASRKNLDHHMLTHDTQKQRLYQCDQCTLSFFTRPLLTRHLQTHISERNIKCPDCGKFFSTQDILRTHFYNVHNAAYTTICDQCGKLFRRPDAFRRHQLEHDGIMQPLVPCEKCGVKLTSKYGLKRHMESMHPETEVTHVCNTCGKVAPSAAALQRHISYMHKMERKYKCPMCDKAFKKTGALKPKEDDENARFICCSCWNQLDSFHKFYTQVEQAHVALEKARPTVHIGLKEEQDQAAIQSDDEDDEKFESCVNFLTADVKVEVKEDSEVCLQQINPLPDIEDKIDINHITPSNDKHSPVSSDSEDSESEIPLANLAKSNPSRKKRRTSANSGVSDRNELESSADWEDQHLNNNEDDDDNDDDDDDDDDSEYEVKKQTPKAKSKQTTKSGKKRGRPRKNAPRVVTPKKTTEEQIKKRELSQEYDEIIEKNMKLICNVCLLPLANFFILKKHYRAKHNERGYASCCGKKFLKRGILVDHIYTHLNPEHFKCDKCDKVLADRRCLEVHMNTHVTEKHRIYQCNQCCKSFFKKPLLTRHLHIHIPQEERKFPCEECKKFFPSNYTLRAHINNVHQNVYAKICDQCGKSIRGREAFQRHLLEHAGVPIPSVQCDKCGAKLKNKYGLKRHMNSMHAEVNVPHVCSICGKTAPNNTALQRHYSYVHKCERNHKCPMCDKAFKKAGGLKEHMTTHTGEVLYTCPHCPKTFNSNANMHSHRKKMHRTEWEANRRHPHMGATERRLE